MNNREFAEKLKDIAKKVESYPNCTVQYLQIEIWKQQDILWLTIPLLRIDGRSINLNYKIKKG